MFNKSILLMVLGHFLQTPVFAASINLSHYYSANSATTQSAQTLQNIHLPTLMQLVRLDQELRLNNQKFQNLIESAEERWFKNGNEFSQRIFLNPSELNIARAYEVKISKSILEMKEIYEGFYRDSNGKQSPYPFETDLITGLSANSLERHLTWFLATVRAQSDTITDSPTFTAMNGAIQAGQLIDGKPLANSIPEGMVTTLIYLRSQRAFSTSLDQWQNVLNTLTEEALSHSPLAKEIANAFSKTGLNVGIFSNIHDYSRLQALRSKLSIRFKSPVKRTAKNVMRSIMTAFGDFKPAQFKKVGHGISTRQVDEMLTHLKPGDILLNRVDYYPSGQFMDGFFYHSALFLGTVKQWGPMKMSNGVALQDDEWVKANIIPNYKSIHDDSPAVVMESTSEGVFFSGRGYALERDAMAILKPVLPAPEQEAITADAIRRAFQYYGRPYDFDYDLGTDDKIMCNELVYRAWDPVMNFSIQRTHPNRSGESIPGVTTFQDRDFIAAMNYGRYALWMDLYPTPDKEIGYPGKRLELTRIYRKGDPDKSLIEMDREIVKREFRGEYKESVMFEGDAAKREFIDLLRYHVDPLPGIITPLVRIDWE